MAQPWEENDRLVGDGGFGANDQIVGGSNAPPNMGPVEPKPNAFMRAKQGAGEGLLNFGTSMIAGPVSKIAGTLTSSMDPYRDEPQGPKIEQSVAQALTYQPKSELGQKTAYWLNTPSRVLDAIASYGGRKAEEATGSPMVGEMAQKSLAIAPAAIGRSPASGGMFGSGVGMLEQNARNWMQSAIKPDKTARMTNADQRAITTMLDEGINATRGGMEKVDAKIQAADDMLSRIIANSTANVDVYRAASQAQESLRNAMNQVNWKKDRQAVLDSVNEFLDHPAIQHVIHPQSAIVPYGQMGYPNQAYVPIQTAQELKRGTYRSLRQKAALPYGEQNAAGIETQKDIARGLKQEIEKGAPEAKDVNKTLGDLVNVQEVVEPRVQLEHNKNPGGLAPLTHGMKTALALLLARDPLTKSLIARGIYNFDKTLDKTAPVGAQISTLPPDEQAAKAPPRDYSSLSSDAVDAISPMLGIGTANAGDLAGYQVVNTRTGQTLGYYPTLKRAHSAANKHDLDYGATTTVVRRIPLPGPTMPGK